jgi:N-terminal domain on NACHT_NTPase and P-loop NTPases
VAGAEAVLALGVISSVITIIDCTKQVYDVAKEAKGLPEAFRNVANRLPTILSILKSVQQEINDGTVDETACEGMEPLIEACRNRAKILDDLFKRVLPADDASRPETYFKAVKTLGKGGACGDVDERHRARRPAHGMPSGHEDDYKHPNERDHKSHQRVVRYGTINP